MDKAELTAYIGGIVRLVLQAGLGAFLSAHGIKDTESFAALMVIVLTGAWSIYAKRRALYSPPPPQTPPPSNSQTSPSDSGQSTTGIILWLFAWLFIIIAAICFCSSCTTANVTVYVTGPSGTNAIAREQWSGSTNAARAEASGTVAINVGIYSHKTVAPDTTATIPLK